MAHLRKLYTLGRESDEVQLTWSKYTVCGGNTVQCALYKSASDCQCRRSRNSPGFDPSILRHRGIWGAPDDPLLNKEQKKSNPPACTESTFLILLYKPQKEILIAWLKPFKRTEFGNMLNIRRRLNQKTKNLFAVVKINPLLLKFSWPPPLPYILAAHYL